MWYNTAILKRKGWCKLKVILVSGKAESGKDLVGEVLKQEFEHQQKKVLVVHFADYLKFMCRQYFGWNGNKDEAGRTLMQYVGTDLFRGFEKDYFANRIHELLSVAGANWDYVIIPDLRFKNEFRRIKYSFDTVAIRVSRTGYESSLTAEQKSNQSETELDNHLEIFDYIIDTNDAGEKIEQTKRIAEELLNG